MTEYVIKKLRFDVTQSQTPKVKAVLTFDIEKVGEKTVDINLESQVMFLMLTKKDGDIVDIFKNGDWYNVNVPAETKDKFTEGHYRIYNHFLNSISDIRKGGQTLISIDEKKSMFEDFVDDTLPLYEVAVDKLQKTKNKGLKAVIKGIEGTAKDQLSAIELIDRVVSRFDCKFNQTYKVDKTINSDIIEEDIAVIEE